MNVTFDAKTYELRIARATNSQETAEAVIAAIQAATSENATKADVEALRADMNAGFERLERTVGEKVGGLETTMERRLGGLWVHIYTAGIGAAILVVGSAATLAHYMRG